MITKLELIEYLKHTPENTNYNILRSGLYNGSNKEIVDEFIEVLSRGNLSLAALQPYLAKLYEDDKTISPDPLPPFSSGGSSVPKPLTYDYMPEGYPSKATGTVTVMEEQELAFASAGDIGCYAAIITNTAAIAEGETYTVNWDGTEYERICATFNSRPIIGNLSIRGLGDDTGEPFLYMYNAAHARGACYTLDTSATHTISVKTTKEIVTPMAEEFLPSGVTAEAIDNAQATADAAQTAATNAQNTATNAQTAADNAQTAADNAVKYTTSQNLTDTQKQQARANIGAGTSSFSGSYNDLTDKPTAVQSDWEVNNDSNVAYIKNRTHYERTEYSSIFLKNNPIASSPINDIYYCGEKTGSSLSIDEGNIYKVHGSDGNTYISTCQRVPIPGLAETVLEE